MTITDYTTHKQKHRTPIHCKKELAVFPSPAGMSLMKLFLGGNNLIFPAQGEFDN